MSFFGKIFASKKETITTGEAIQKLRETEEMLIKKQEFLEKKIDQEIETAKKNGSKNKRAAIQALKRKKRFEQQLQKIDGTLSTIEMQREALEGANTNTAVLTNMKSAADALKAAHQQLDVDQVHAMMDDIAEQQDVSREISEAISNSMNLGQDYDEDELEKELEDLQQEELDNELLGVKRESHELPEVPAGDITETIITGKDKNVKSKKFEDEDDLNALMSWAN